MAYQETVSAPTNPVVTAQGRYEQLSTSRSPALQRGRDAAALTIPSLLPPAGATDATILPTPFQSVGARGVNNLSSKLLLALFPPGSSFFRLRVDTFVMDKLRAKAQASGESDPTEEIEDALAKVENAVINRMEQKATRAALNEGLKHLVACGNVLLQEINEGGLRFYTLANYVVKRDGEGTPVEIIAKECLSRRTLPSEVLKIIESTETSNDQKDVSEGIDVYTWVQRQENGSWSVHQEVLGIKIPSSVGTYPADKSAWFPLRWSPMSGSDYGRGHVEEYYGDLNSLESLSQSIVEFAANAAKTLWFNDPAGFTSTKAIVEAPSGAVLEGNAKDVTILQMEKFADFQVVKATASDIEHRLEQAFLLNSSIQRQAERVTAEVIRFMAGELEQALGGTYSILGQELQRPLVTRLMTVMAKSGKLPHLPEKLVAPQIITGLDGLGRSSDMMKLDLLIQGVGQLVGPQAVGEYVNVGGYLKRRATALGIPDLDGVIRTEEEVQATRQQQAQQAMAQKLGPAGIKAMSDQALAAQQQPQEGAASPAQQS